MSKKKITYHFSEFLKTFTYPARDLLSSSTFPSTPPPLPVICNLFITYIDVQNKLRTRFGAASQ